MIIEKPNPQEAINWEISLHAAYEKGFELFFPVAPAAQQFQMLDVAHALNEKMLAESDPATYQNSIEYGKYVAQTVYEWSKKDAWGHEAYLSNSDPSYLPPQGVGLWKPTYPDFSPALLPHWGKVRTFAALATDKSIPPLDFNTNASSELFAQAKETKELVDDIKAGLEDEQLWIAEFWSDDCPILTFTPAGRWVSITNQLIGQESLNMMDAVLVYARLGFALSDAGVKCWAEKYKHNCLRPIDFIREYMGDPDWNTVMCPDGTGGYYTPNFPTFPSGHATFSGAAAVVLEDFFGRSYRFTDRSHEGRTEFRGAPRTFNSFREMAEENAYSRIPLGVHFKIDSDAGTDLGYRIGERVLGLPWK
ncbi:MAG: vanadium-dependent haloperoxidase [Saprospiraceae bacterium]